MKSDLQNFICSYAHAFSSMQLLKCLAVDSSEEEKTHGGWTTSHQEDIKCDSSGMTRQQRTNVASHNEMIQKLLSSTKW